MVQKGVIYAEVVLKTANGLHDGIGLRALRALRLA